MKLYSIEITGEKYKSYRFVSLYNGTRGTFCFDKDEAIMQGEDHQKIILAIHPELKSIVKENNISERIKNALKARKEQGVKLGRPAGLGKKVEQAISEKGLKEQDIKKHIEKGILNASSLGRLLDVDKRTAGNYIKAKGIKKGKGE